MSIRKSRQVIAFFFIGLTVATGFIVATRSAFSLHGQGVNSMPAAAEKRIALLDLLSELSETQNYFFTIEQASKEGESMNWLEAVLVPKNSKEAPVLQQLEELKRTVPNFTFEINEKNPQIIHVIDVRLAQQKEYGLNKDLANIDFEGKTRDLVTAINNKGVAISPQNSFSVGIPMLVDLTTIVHVKGENLKVRDALTNFIPLREYNGIIWTATTKLGSGQTTFINFRGNRVPKKRLIP